MKTRSAAGGALTIVLSLVQFALCIGLGLAIVGLGVRLALNSSGQSITSLTFVALALGCVAGITMLRLIRRP